MAALSLVELLKGVSDPVASGVIENIITTDQLLGSLPMQSVGTRGSLTFRREKALPSVSKPASAGSITADASLEFTRVSTFCRRLVVDQDLDILDAGEAGGLISARAAAISKASKAIARTFGDDIITGNSNWTVTVNDFGSSGYSAATIVVGPGHDPSRGAVGTIKYTHSGTTVQYKAPGDVEYGAAVTYSAGVKVYSDNEDKWITVNFSSGSASANGVTVFTISGGDQEVDGVQRLVTSGQTISSTGTNGDAIALATLDQLADLVTDNGGPKAYFMTKRTRRAVMALLRAAGGATMMEYKDATAPMGNPTTVQVPMYNGIPILCSDFIPVNESKGSGSTLTSVYCATLGPDAGLSVIYSDASLDAEDVNVISRGPGGLTVVDLGTVQNADVKRVRVKAYWGLVNKSEKGLARAKEITS